MQADANWVSVIGSLLLTESNPSIGAYADRIGLQGGPYSGVLVPNKTWDQTFDLPGRGGLAAYLISPFAVPEALNDAAPEL